MSTVIDPSNPVTREPLPDGGFEIRGIEDAENRLEGSSGSDRIFGGNLNDVLSGSTGSGADTISGGDGDDNISGGDGNDELSGDAGNDLISGGGGANIITGGAGNDRLIAEGGSGTTLTGGAGQDTFQFNFNQENGTVNEITDFTSGEDRIVIQGLPGTQAPVYNRDTGILSLDDLEIAQLSAGLNISENDLEIVGNNNPISNVNNEEAIVYRFFNPSVGVHFYTSNEAERDNVQENLSNYDLEGESYRTADPTTGAQQVYRFFNEETGVHLYTTSEAERDSIITNLPNFQFEGVQFYAYETEVEGSIPIYRFYEPTLGVHFYTPSAAERDNVQANLPNYNYEGIAYYALPIDQGDV